MSKDGFLIPTSGDDDESGQQTMADHTAGTAASSPTSDCLHARHIDKNVIRATSTSPAKPNYHRNQQYSVTALTDTTGTISERYAYDAYGKLTVTDGSGTVLAGSAYSNRYTYTGREWDVDLGLYHYRARMYSPDTGRFVSRDPIGYDLKHQRFGLYEYVASNPERYVDPSGLYQCMPAALCPQNPQYEEGKKKRESCESKCLAEIFGIDNVGVGAGGCIAQACNKTRPKPRVGIAGGGKSGGWTSWSRRCLPKCIGRPLGRIGIGTAGGVTYACYSTYDFGDCVFDCISGN